LSCTDRPAEGCVEGKFMMHHRYTCFALIALLCWAASTTILAAETKDHYEWKGGRWIKTATPGEATPQGQLALIRRLNENGKYKQSVKSAKKFVKKYSADERLEEVCLLAGQAEMNRRRYYQAYEWFEEQLNRFPSGQYSDRALQYEYEVAEAFLRGEKRVALGFMRLSATDEGLEILQRICEHAPGTQLAEKSLLRVADFHYGKNRYPEAIHAYDAFLELFAKSPKAGYAMVQSARAAWASYRGLQFDDTALLEAEQRFRTLLESYPAAAAKCGASDMLRQISAARAHKLQTTAIFYERTGKPSAAAFYYRQIMQQYPGTQWAKDAQVAAAKLGEVKPIEPKNSPVPVPPRGPKRADMPKTSPSAESQGRGGTAAVPKKGSEGK